MDVPDLTGGKSLPLTETEQKAIQAAGPVVASAAPATPPQTGKPATQAQQSIQQYVTTPKVKKSQVKTAEEPKPTPANPPEQSGNDLIPGSNNEDSIADTASKAVSNIKITAGLGIAFGVLIFLLWALVPTASGYTRLQLLWFTIIGETKLTTDSTPSRTTTQTTGPVVIPNPTPTTASTPTALVPLNTTDTEQIIPDSFSTGSGPSSNGHTLMNIDLSALNYYGDF